MSLCYILANFGGPRDLKEVRPFLRALLTDRDVIRTPFPRFLEFPLFYLIATQRVGKVSEDYRSIGGKSPIYEDTEALKKELESRLKAPVVTFHRYLEDTHAAFIEEIISRPEKEIIIFPLFPQFTFATSGSVARWFSKNLPRETVDRFRWVRSYPKHPEFIDAHVRLIDQALKNEGISEKDAILLFSAHGLPKAYIEEGDPYLAECRASFESISKSFPEALSRLSYQSQFGKQEWVRPYTSDVVKDILDWNQGRKSVFFVPVSFTSDHIETLFEIEDAYMPPVRKAGLSAYRVPALNLSEAWKQAIPTIIQDSVLTSNESLIRR